MVRTLPGMGKGVRRGGTKKHRRTRSDQQETLIKKDGGSKLIQKTCFVGCVLGVPGFLWEILVSCGSEGGLWASGHGHVCWVVSMTRALTFNDKRPSFQRGAPDLAMILGS